jgi:hypothetical protein
MPVRFTSPSLGGQRESFFDAGEWQVGVAYRRLYADQWFVGTRVDESAAPFGRPLYLDIHSLDVSVAYGVSRQTSLTLTLPFAYGTHSRFYADQQRHRVEAYGLGDVSLVGNHWVLDPATHAGGNVALGLGIKTPSGNNEFEDEFFNADSTVGRRVVDQAIQLGDGGWGFLVQVQAYQRLLPDMSGYVFGSYLVSPREKTAVPAPLPGTTLSVPDVYTARAGLAYAAWMTEGLSLNLGLRIDGIPLRDLVGGEDGFRRPGYTLFLDPGLALRRGRSELTFSLPLRLHQDFQQSLIDRERDFRGGGDLADYLIYLGLTRRF